jgi:hypothetical protein
MYREQEIRKIMNDNCWKRETNNGIEYFNKDYYDSNYNRIENKLLIEIENELNN